MSSETVTTNIVFQFQDVDSGTLRAVADIARRTVEGNAETEAEFAIDRAFRAFANNLELLAEHKEGSET